MPRYKVIMHEHRDPETDVPLFWNNEDGWVSMSEATLFDVDAGVELPAEGWGTVELPEEAVSGQREGESGYLLDDDQLNELRAILTQYVEDCDSDAGERVDLLWRILKDAREVPGIFRAYVDTRHFDFEAYGATEAEAIDACYEGWHEHCRSYRPDVELDPDYVTRDDIGVYPITIGEGYRDREPIKQGNTG